MPPRLYSPITKVAYHLNQLCELSRASLLAQQGGTTVLVTVCAAPLDSHDAPPVPRQAIAPITVNYQEKMQSINVIPATRTRSDAGPPSARETLTSRLIDRSVRPLVSPYSDHALEVSCEVLSA